LLIGFLKDADDFAGVGGVQVLEGAASAAVDPLAANKVLISFQLPARTDAANSKPIMLSGGVQLVIPSIVKAKGGVTLPLDRRGPGVGSRSLDVPVASKVYHQQGKGIFMRKLFGALVLIAAVALIAPRLLHGAAVPAVGTAAPDFTLNSQEGKPVTLSQFRGKWVVLYFYPKDMTSGCTIEAHNFQRDQAQYDTKNAVVLGVSVQDTQSHQQFCTKEGLTFKLLADPDDKVTEEYGSLKNYGVAKLAARHTFLIDPQGKIVKEYMDVDPNKHSEEVLAELTVLQK
jgi:peroxiredoxin Q/BCP